MKNPDIADRVADRIGLSRSAAGNAADAVFEAVGAALANGEEVRIAGDVYDEEPAGPYAAQSADRQEPRDTGVDGAGVQARQGAQGCHE